MAARNRGTRRVGHPARWGRAVAVSAVLLAGCQNVPTPVATTAPVWRPAPGSTWQWQLADPVDTGVRAQVFDVDGLDTDSSTVGVLHAGGSDVICYLDIGAVERYRPDAGSFPAPVVGRTVDGWPEERYLDIRRIDLVGPPILHRLDTCRAKGFDGVEGDVVDAYSNDSGFPITAADELAFLSWFAGAAHARGLAVGLKNAVELVPQAVGWFDFAIVEDCVAEDTCAGFSPFIAQGKAVFDAEYTISPATFCPPTAALGISAIAKRVALDAWRVSC